MDYGRFAALLSAFETVDVVFDWRQVFCSLVPTSLISCEFTMSQKLNTFHGFLHFTTEKKLGAEAPRILEEEVTTTGETLKQTQNQTQNQTPFNNDTTEKTGVAALPRMCSNPMASKNRGINIALNATANLAVSFATARIAKNICIARIPPGLYTSNTEQAMCQVFVRMVIMLISMEKSVIYQF